MSKMGVLIGKCLSFHFLAFLSLIHSFQGHCEYLHHERRKERIWRMAHGKILGSGLVVVPVAPLNYKGDSEIQFSWKRESIFGKQLPKLCLNDKPAKEIEKDWLCDVRKVSKKVKCPGSQGKKRFQGGENGQLCPMLLKDQVRWELKTNLWIIIINIVGDFDKNRVGSMMGQWLVRMTQKNKEWKLDKVGMNNSFQNLLNVEEYKGLSATFPVMVAAGNRIHPRWFK